jgi:hypothetical protein
MTRNGTCKHTYQHQEVSSMPEHKDPLDPKSWSHEIMPEVYTCTWLDARDALPPPVARWKHTAQLRDGDCDTCPHYTPAATIPQSGRRS